MQDLHATIFYKVKFHIQGDEQKDLLWKLMWHLKSWLGAKWGKRVDDIGKIETWSKIKFGTNVTFSSSESSETVHILSEYFYDAETERISWACRITENPAQAYRCAPREWITEFGFEQSKPGLALVSCVLSYRDRAGYIGLCEEAPSPSVPRVIRYLLSDEELYCHYGSDKITMEAEKLSPGEWPAFWERLTAPERKLPYIYISPCLSKETGEGEEPTVSTFALIDPQTLARILGGNALVFYADDPAFIEEMNHFCPKGYLCYGGAVRVYYPDLRPEVESDSARHRYLSHTAIEEFGKEQALGILRRALAQDVNFYDSFLRIEECVRRRKEKNRRVYLSELAEKHKRDMESAESQALELASEEEKRTRNAENMFLEEAAKVDALTEELDALQAENYSLKAIAESLRSSAQKGKDLERAANSRLQFSEMPMSAEDVVRYFEVSFGDTLAFSEEAKRSLKGCSLDSSELWRVFYALAVKLHPLYFFESGDILRKFHNETGILCKRGEGSNTHQDKRLMRQYLIRYGDEEIDIETHITYPKEAQSIHLGFSEKEQKVVIGHCGEHLDNYSTQKRK